MRHGPAVQLAACPFSRTSPASRLSGCWLGWLYAYLASPLFPACNLLAPGAQFPLAAGSARLPDSLPHGLTNCRDRLGCLAWARREPIFRTTQDVPVVNSHMNTK